MEKDDVSKMYICSLHFADEDIRVGTYREKKRFHLISDKIVPKKCLPKKPYMPYTLLDATTRKNTYLNKKTELKPVEKVIHGNVILIQSLSLWLLFNVLR